METSYRSAKVWRAGANEATTFVTSRDVVLGGKTVPADHRLGLLYTPAVLITHD
jgi:hypothetical protein